MRKFRLSEEVDWEFEEERQRLVAEEEAEAEHQSNADAFMNPTDYEETFTTSASTQSDRYTRRSTIAERLQLDMEYQLFPSPEILRSRNVSPRVKDAIASVSHQYAISVLKVCVAFQTVCEKAYSHHYYLTPEEQQKFEPSLESIQEDDEESLDVSDDDSTEPESKKPRTAEQYIISYKHVLLSARSVGSLDIFCKILLLSGNRIFVVWIAS